MKIRKFSSVLLLMLVVVFGIPYRIGAAEDYKIMDPKYNISPNHEFSIRLSQELDESSLKDGTVKIYDRATLKTVDILVRRDTYDARVIKVKGKNDFEIGKTYTIEIKNLRSTKGKYFKESIRMDFVVKNRYSGLPAENGLIIVDDKAYSIDYLMKNRWMANEIITKSYDVYYTYDVNYEKIYSLFKNGSVYGRNSGTIHPTITYIDPQGKSHLYIWKSGSQEYQLAEPKASVEVIVRSEAKAVNINVLSVSAVPDAKYYRIKNSNLIKNFGEPLLYVASEDSEEISILAEDKSVLAKGAVSINRNNSGEVRLRLSESLSQGNTAANINNNGIATEGEDGYIYYVNSSDKEKLYKQGVGGIYDRAILEDKAQYVNVSGDWIYYSNYSDGGMLYKVRNNGTERQKLVSDKAAYITVSGEYIYYSNHSDGGKLYKVKKDGSDARIWPDNSLHGNPVVVDYGNYNKSVDEVAYINIVGDWIYYSNYSDGHKPYVIHKDGTYRGKLSDNYADCVQVDGDWVYFTSGSGVISKVSKSSMGFVVPIKGVTSEFNKGYHINVHQDWIYYSNAEDEGKLYKISTDGSGNKTKLSDESVGYINIVGDWIYFTTPKNKLFKLPVGTNGDAESEEVGKTKDPNKIAEVEDVYKIVDFADVNQTTEWLEKKYLPQKVAAIMGDNTIQQLVVSWDTNPGRVTAKDGVRTYKGILVGYNKTINLYMTIPSEMLNDTNKISVYKNGNKNDMIIVEGNEEPDPLINAIRRKIGEGDVIKVYEDSDKKKLLGSGTVGRDGRASVSRLDLDQDGRSFYITITRVKKAESNPTEIKQYRVPVLRSEDVEDRDLTGIGADTRDITVKSWRVVNYLERNYNPLSQEIYIVPSKAALDMYNNTYIKSLDFKNSRGEIITSWDGLETPIDAVYGKDSLGKILKSGNYDLYVANVYEGKASPDINGWKPVVEGKIANGKGATFEIIEEGIPARPTIKTQRVQSSGYDLPNQYVYLDKPLKDGETAWLIPTDLSIDILNSIRSWRAETSSLPFEELVEAYDIAKYSGTGTVMQSPVVGTDVERDYKLFITNSVGVSIESSNKITVDNRKPMLLLNNTPVGNQYYVGDVIFARSDEKGKIYVVKPLVPLEPTALEDAVKTQNAISIGQAVGGSFMALYKSETLIDFITIGDNVDASYRVVAVDEAGNVTDQRAITSNQGFIEILISRDFATLTGVLELAQKEINKTIEAGQTPLPALVTAVKKGRDLYNKVYVKQSEINASVKEITALGTYSSDLSISSRDKNIRFDTDGYIRTFQMTVGDFISKLMTNGTLTIYNNETDEKNNKPLTNANNNQFITDGMIVKIETVTGTGVIRYKVYVDGAIISEENELRWAIEKNKNIKEITITAPTMRLNQDIIVGDDRVTDGLKIKGNTAGTVIILNSDVSIINNGKLILSGIEFRGETSAARSEDVLINNKDLTLENCQFNNFIFGVDGKSVINSLSGAKLSVSYILKNPTFSGIDTSSQEDTFSYISIDSKAAQGTKVEGCIFEGTEFIASNVRGISINGIGGTNEIFISKNKFINFTSSAQNSMATPIYVNGGIVNLSGNIVNGSESGIFIDVVNGPVKVGSYIVGGNVDNYSKAGSNMSSSNKSVKENYFGDIMIGKIEAGKVPIIYYNSTSTPTIGDIILEPSGGKYSLTINTNKLSDSNNFYYRQESHLEDIITKGTVIKPEEYTLYSGGGDIIDSASGNYIVIVEVDKGNKVVKFRQLSIPSQE